MKILESLSGGDFENKNGDNKSVNSGYYKGRPRPCCKGRKKSYLESVPVGTLNISRRGSAISVSGERRMSLNYTNDRRLSMRVVSLNFAVTQLAAANSQLSIFG